MPFTTDMTRELERGQTRRKLQDAAARTPGGGGFVDPGAAAPTEGRSFGFRSGATTPGGVADQHLLTAAVAGRELGEPSSFRGGAGAPEPIAVMRGLRTTYSPGRLEGSQFALPEVATRTEAQQAWNREQANLATAAASRRGLTDPSIEARFGGFRPPGQTLTEIAGMKEGPGATAKRTAEAGAYGAREEQIRQEMEQKRQEQNVGRFGALYKSRFGPSPKEGTKGYDDYYDALAHAREYGEKAGIDRYIQTHQFRQFEPLFTTENLAAHGMAVTPEMQQDPNVWREFVLRFGPRLQQLTGGRTAGTAANEVLTGTSPFTVGP